MKKRMFYIIVLLLVFISGCTSKPTSLVVENITANLEGFDITEYSFEAQYEKEKQIINFTEDMFSSEDLQKLETLGEHNVTFNYKGLTKQFIITLEETPKRIEVEEIRTCIDSFDITDYMFKVVYEEQEVYINYSLDMFTKEDQSKFQLEGEHLVTLNYKGLSEQVKVILEEFKIASLRGIADSYVYNIREFEYYMIEFQVLYNDNTVETVSLERDYLSNKDIIALSKAGTHTVTINYDEFELDIQVELIPDEKPIDELKQDIIVYCTTVKVDDKYVSSFFIKGNEVFNGAQFKVAANDDVEDINVTDVHPSVVVSGEKELIVTCVYSENIEAIRLFDVQYSSPQQYRNFNLDFSFDRKITKIESGEVIEFDSSDIIYTFTR